MTIIVAGSTAELTIQFADEAGALFDPDDGTGFITLRAPSDPLDGGVVTAVEDVDNPSVGTYSIEFDTTEGGRWRWRAEGMQNGKHRVGEGAFDVQHSRVVATPLASS